MEESDAQNSYEYSSTRVLTEEESAKLNSQNGRLVSDFKATKFSKEAQRHWDLFYKRNETKFFKDRHWTTREFRELAEFLSDENSKEKSKLILLEVGCGVGNFVFPLLEEQQQQQRDNFFIYACDFSSRAIDFVRNDSRYREDRIKAFVHDITLEFENLPFESVDIVSMVFVLSAIKPELFAQVFSNVRKVLKPGGLFLFRDYGLYDMAQLRFKPGTKIRDNYYLRQDGTTTYFFSLDEISRLCDKTGFLVEDVKYVHRRTVNKKEDVDVPRIFIQGKYRKN